MSGYALPLETIVYVGEEGEVRGTLLKRYDGCCSAEWRKRYCVIRGHYLFKYKSHESHFPKGTPINLAEVDIVQEEGGFRLDAVRKSYSFRALDAEECVSWVQALCDVKTRALKQRLGHEETTQEEREANREGRELEQRKARMEEKELDDLKQTPYY